MKIKRSPSRAEVPSAAMGDIAFNLLVFFVILARAQDDSHLQWQAAKSHKTEAARSTRVSVLIDVNYKTYVNGQPTSQAQLAGVLRDMLEGVAQEDRQVLLKVHKETPAMYFEPVIEAVSEAGGQLLHVLDKKQ